jgi:hypothetical protein
MDIADNSQPNVSQEHQPEASTVHAAGNDNATDEDMSKAGDNTVLALVEDDVKMNHEGVGAQGQADGESQADAAKRDDNSPLDVIVQDEPANGAVSRELNVAPCTRTRCAMYTFRLNARGVTILALLCLSLPNRKYSSVSAVCNAKRLLNG